MKPVLRRLRFHRFSTVSCSLLLAFSSSFHLLSKRSKVETLIVSILFSLVLCLCGPCRCGAQRRSGHRDRACHSRDRRQVDQPFPAGPGSTCRLSRCRTRLIAFVVANLLGFILRAPVGKHRSAVCEHFGLSDVRFNVGDGLLARGPVDARGCLLLQHERRSEIDRGFQWLSTLASSH